MKLIGINENPKTGELELYRSVLPGMIDSFISFFAAVKERPRIILTEKEAEEWGLDPKKSKGYYHKIQGIRVPIDIE